MCPSKSISGGRQQSATHSSLVEEKRPAYILLSRVIFGGNSSLRWSENLPLLISDKKESSLPRRKKRFLHI